MHRSLLILPLILLPLASAQAYDYEPSKRQEELRQQRTSLEKHEHGVASLNVALDGETLEIQLESPALNLVGFEHQASSAADQAKVAAVRQQLQQPQALFALPIDAKCTLQDSALDSPLFGGAGDEHEHSDIDASYRFTCANPQALKTLELGSFFASFPGTERLAVQLIGPSGQQGAELTPSNSRLSF